MAIAYKVLGQKVPTSGNEEVVYTVPAGKSATISSIVIANVNGNTVVTTSATLYVRPSGQAAADRYALVKNSTVLTYGELIAVTNGMTLSAGDIISVQALFTNSICVHVFGGEIT
jgi:hypothetical protein